MGGVKSPHAETIIALAPLPLPSNLNIHETKVRRPHLCSYFSCDQKNNSSSGESNLPESSTCSESGFRV